MTYKSILKLGAAGMFLAGSPAFAQGAEPVADGASGVSDIVVTAQRREQRLQDVPLTVSAFGGDRVDQLQMSDAVDIAKFVPSMHITQSAFKGSATYFIRGIGTLDITSTNDPPITTYVNDVIIARPNANNVGLFDIDRIEVLRGPQGTLFGRNTSGGAVNIVLKKPSRDFGGYMEGSYGSFDKWSLRGSVDTPISDTILAKTSGFFVTDPGYIKNVTTGKTNGNEENWGIRQDLRLYVGEALTWDLAGEYTRNWGVGIPLRQSGQPASSPLDPPPSVYYETQTGVLEGDCQDPMSELVLGARGNCSTADSLALTSTMAFDLDAGSLELLYGFRQYWAAYSYDGSNLPGQFGGANFLSDGYGYAHSAELKWSSSILDDRITYVGGLFYLNAVDQNRLSEVNGTSGVPVVTGDRTVRTSTDSFAAYLQADAKIIDPLTLTLGGRFTHDIKRLGYIASTEYPGVTLGTEDVLAAGMDLKQVENRFTPRVALQYKFTDDISVYTSATNGFKSGGWNARVTVPNRVVSVSPERVWAYELGLRSQFFDRRLTANLTLFRQDMKGYQNTVQVILPGETVSTAVLANVADLRAQGLEFEFNFQVTPELSLFANGSRFNTKYTKTYLFPGIPADQQLTDAYIPAQAPKFKLNLGPTLTLPTNDGTVTASAIWRHSTPYQITILSPVRTPKEDYVDLNIRYEADSNWYASLGCTNCLDKKSYMLVVRNNVYPVDPRRVTGTVGFRF